MRELLTMWRETRMVMLVAVVAATYAATLFVFAGLVILPGFTGVRPGAVVPVVFGLMFGPAGAWGAAVGNLLNDVVTGQLTPGSPFGFLGNLVYGLLGYKLWGNLGPLSSGLAPDFRERPGRQLLEFVVVGLAATAACAAIIAWGLDLLGLFPFSVFATIVFLNNAIAVVVLGPPLLYLLYPRIEAMGLCYPDLLGDDELSRPGPSRARTAAFGLVAVSVAWLAAGIALSLGVTDVPFGLDEGAVFGQGGAIEVAILGGVAFLALLALTAISGERLSTIGR